MALSIILKRNFISLRLITNSSLANGFKTFAPCCEEFVPIRDPKLFMKTRSLAKYGGRHAVTLLPGHGIGPELMSYVKEVFRYGGVPVDFEELKLNPDTEDEKELSEVLTSIQRNGVALKGNIETKANRPNFKSRNVIFREKFNLFAFVMHTKNYPGIKTRHENIDMIIVRQNTEGEYKMLEHENVKGVVESFKICTTENSELLARYAFDYARKYKRKKVTAVHKANIMKLADGLFLHCCRQVAKEFPDIEFDDMIVDNCCMQLVTKPQQFDVIVTSNLYGNIVGNLVCGLIGGAGLFSGRNYGHSHAIFEPGTRNTGSYIVGKNIANPISMLNASADLLEHLELTENCTILRNAINKVINEDKIHTPDLGGQATSYDVVDAIIKDVQKNTKKWKEAGLSKPLRKPEPPPQMDSANPPVDPVI